MSFRLRARLGDMTSDRLDAALSSGRRTVALVPIGAVEPHGPHLPLGTDTRISETACARAVEKLAVKGLTAFVAPSIPYGVTRLATGFAGAISVPAQVLSVFLHAVARGFLDSGFTHVCLVNNHLEPPHDAAVRAAISGLPPSSASVASPLSRRWASTLSEEFKRGARHAGRYETSLILAATPEAVDWTLAAGLPDIEASLSEGIEAGKESFLEMGLDRSYTGAPARASAEEGEIMLDRLATMIATEVIEALALRRG